MDSQVDRGDVFVAVPNYRSIDPISVEFTQSQHSGEGIGANRSVVDDFIDGEYTGGVDDESEG